MYRSVWLTLLAATLLLPGFEASAIDSDGDGRIDAVDNCLSSPNPKQGDPDQDGYGSRCDADFDNDGDVDQADVDIYSSGWCGSICDLDEDGIVGNFNEVGLLFVLVGHPPGPSGLACAGTVPCSELLGTVPALGTAATAGLLLALLGSALALRRRWMAT